MRFFIALSLCLSAFYVHASIEKGTYLSLDALEKEKVLPEKRLPLLRMVLKLPREKKIQSLKKMPWATRFMAEKSFDKRLHMAERWQLMITLGGLDPQNKAIERALRHKDWFMRNAGLLALSYGSRKRAIEWSRKLLDDPALVVRGAAVKVIRDLKAKEMEALLWSKLRSKENFRSGEGLWIRKNIVETLGDFAYPGQEVRFIELLHDQDTRVHVAAMGALEKLTKTRLKRATAPQQRKAWLSWWGEKAASSASPPALPSTTF